MKRYPVVIQVFIFAISLPAFIFAANRTDSEIIRHANQVIHIQFASDFNQAEREQTIIWLKTVTDALLTVYGEWPKQQFNIRIKRSSGRDGPVPWGQVTRGDPDNVLLVINPDPGLQTFIRDWTAYHEISHLLIPYRGYGDLWFSEGLATYYQNIIQARAGLLDEKGLWRKLVAGFERGKKQNQWSRLDLTEISDNMGEYRSFMRVHWSGVHYWLSADIKLRQASQNNTTLDSVLQQLKICCQHRSMSAQEIAAKLDQIAGVEIFEPGFYRYRSSRAMPDYKAIMKSLGVSSRYNNRGYEITLMDSVPDAQIRKRIYLGNDPE